MMKNKKKRILVKNDDFGFHIFSKRENSDHCDWREHLSNSQRYSKSRFFTWPFVVDDTFGTVPQFQNKLFFVQKRLFLNYHGNDDDVNHY